MDCLLYHAKLLGKKGAASPKSCGKAFSTSRCRASLLPTMLISRRCLCMNMTGNSWVSKTYNCSSKEMMRRGRTKCHHHARGRWNQFEMESICVSLQISVHPYFACLRRLAGWPRQHVSGLPAIYVGCSPFILDPNPYGSVSLIQPPDSRRAGFGKPSECVLAANVQNVYSKNAELHLLNFLVMHLVPY